MNQYIVELISGLITGIFYGITGILPAGLIIIFLNYLNIGNYRSNLGAISFLNLLPISLGAFYNFYKTNNINFTMGIVLFLSIVIGGFLGSQLVVEKKFQLSKKTIDYISSALGFITGIVFLISAQMH